MRILIPFFLLFSSSFAHKLNIFLSQENEKVQVSSYFASGSFCKNCKIEVITLDNKLLIESKTDEKGEFIFDKPENSVFVRVEAIGGHAVKTKYEIDIKDSKKTIDKKSITDSLIESLIAILLIVGIFILLKRLKKWVSLILPFY